MRTYYAHPVDVLRKFNPQMTEATLDQDDFIGGPGDLEQVLARLEGVESQFERLTGRPLREMRVGKTGRNETYEIQGADLRRHQSGIKVWLEHANVMPIDYDAGDRIEIRTGRDNWRDVTQDTSRFDLNNQKGYIRFYSRYQRNFWRNAIRDAAIRLTYRYGALGSHRDEAGETTLTGDVLEGDTDINVEDSTYLPDRGIVKLSNEYVLIEDNSNDTLTVQRGKRGTTSKGHTTGDVIHYCPLDVREAIAAKTAVELLSYADWVNELVDADGMSISDKQETWESEWELILSKYSEVKMY